MTFNSKLGLHLTGILLVLCLLTYMIFFKQYYATILTLILILVFQVVSLQRHINSTNRMLARFISAIRYADFSQSFKNKRLNASFTELGDSMDEVMHRFQQSRSDKEVQAAYLLTLIEQIPIAVCSINQEGKILLSNEAFCSLFQATKPRHIEELHVYGDDLVSVIKTMEADRGKIVKVNKKQEVLQLKISSTLLRRHGKLEKLITIQNIQNELEAKELDAWQNLIRVMAHEIMNSVTPITSLSETANHCIQDAIEEVNANSGSNANSEAGPDTNTNGHPDNSNNYSNNYNNDTISLLNDASDALQTIGNRSQGLTRFVESYRSLTRLPAPKLQTFALADLFKSIEQLTARKMREQQVPLKIEVTPRTLQLRADPEQLEQALLNLINNALEALETPDSAKNKVNPEIKLKAELLELGRVRISVTDNGAGIAKENLDNIFIPFFTTKRKGSGIGMSIVRQIVRLNGGNINVDSEEGKGTTVLLTF